MFLKIDKIICPIENPGMAEPAAESSVRLLEGPVAWLERLSPRDVG
ncbi:MAG: hypothetical protein QNK05_08835 [Myxococcota bacterium]|nr:hypothetical protein [Myxococcota bacterium]